MEDSNSLDLTDTTEDRVRAPFVFTRDHADWLTTDGQACFARGTGDSVAQSQDEAYWGGPLWRPWNPLHFWRLVLGPSMDKIFARVVIRLAASHCS